MVGPLPAVKEMDEVDVAAVTWVSAGAGPVVALACAGLRLWARTRRDRAQDALVLDLAARMPVGGRLVLQRTGDASVMVLAVPGREN